MATMRQMVSERVDRLSETHAQSKKRKYGFLVRPLTLALGWTVFIVGLITIPLPGQGWLTTFLGVGILSLEVTWAHDLLHWAVRLYDRFFAWFRRQPQSTRIVLVTLLILVIWVIFAGIIYGAWRAGTLDFLTPYAAEIGLER
ncbi:TIGR02611 family protein [Corynebacterium suedekumii]|nr:TIGR02611 family protein [Corynebacterium suedekumii]